MCSHPYPLSTRFVVPAAPRKAPEAPTKPKRIDLNDPAERAAIYTRELAKAGAAFAKQIEGTRKAAHAAWTETVMYRLAPPP